MTNDRPRLIVIAGTNGAGKTTFVDAMPDFSNGERIDPDAIAREMNPGSPEHASLTAGREAVRRLQKAMAERRNIVFETTLAGRQPLSYMHRAQEAGYFVRLIFLGTDDPLLNMQRIARRVSDGGHHIDQATVMRRFERSLANLRHAAVVANQVTLIDNSAEPADMRIVFERIDNIRTLADSAPQWFAKSGLSD